MSCWGWYDINATIEVADEGPRASILKEFDELNLPSKDIYLRVSDRDPLIIHIERVSGEYHRSVDDSLEAIAKWLHEKEYKVDAHIIADIENERLRAEFIDGKVEWASADWLLYYPIAQMRELEQYARQRFN